MGANPHVQAYTGKSEYQIWHMWAVSGVSNIPKIKSVYFQLRDFNSDMPAAWEYKNGVYNQGHFGQVRGRGGEGTVIEGKWLNAKTAAFKFVEVRDEKFIETTDDALNDLNDRLNEMTSMQLTSGSAILKLEGHYR